MPAANDVRIIVVEDERIVAKDIVRRLQRLGYSVPGIASSGEEAIHETEMHHPDLILMDIKLKGGMDGIEAASRILEHYDIPIIYVTAYADEPTLERAKETRPFGYIIKPFEDRDIYSTIEMALYKHRMERLLRESERYLSTVLRSIGDAVIATDMDGGIKYINGVAEALLGIPGKECLERRFDEIFMLVGTTEGRADPIGELGLSDTARVPNTEAVLAVGDGALDIEFTGSQILDDKGEAIGHVVVFRDITERKLTWAELAQYRAGLEALVEQRTTELAKTNADLEEANSALEAFAYSVSHDLRAPLRAMEGFSQALLEDYEDRLDRIGRDYLFRIVDAANRMDQLIQDLLAYNRLSSPDIQAERLNMESVVLDVVSQLDQMVREQQAQIYVEHGLPDAMGHRPTVTMVLQNLLTNAMKFVDPGVGPMVRIWGEPHGERIRLFVQDNGIGIPEEYQSRIFQVFERLHSSDAYPGTGIGLAIVRKGMQRMGGDVGLTSSSGRGSTFWIELPSAGGNGSGPGTAGARSDGEPQK
ncbi:MAG: response regulator [Thermoplasmata archaeon]|nr:response regulator [Thermoplasmata archaeon]